MHCVPVIRFSQENDDIDGNSGDSQIQRGPLRPMNQYPSLQAEPNEFQQTLAALSPNDLNQFIFSVFFEEVGAVESEGEAWEKTMDSRTISALPLFSGTLCFAIPLTILAISDFRVPENRTIARNVERG